MVSNNYKVGGFIMKYKSKIDWWFYLVAIGFAVIIIFLFFSGFTLDNQSIKIVLIITGVLFVGLFLLIIIPVIFCTYYVLEDDYIFIKCGKLSSDKIRYSDIISIEETRNPMASAAPSLDRLGIEYKYESKSYCRNGYILISPKLKHEFLSDISKRNPNIFIKSKK